MIKLYAFGPNFGLPDPSPFCMKAMVLLRMAGISYEFAGCDPRKAPKKKAPYIVDDGVAIPDSTFIRWHLEERHGARFDAHLSPPERATAWAVERMCDEHLYWGIVHERWVLDHNFNEGPARFFDPIPQPMRALVIPIVRRQVRRDLWGQGIGRHSHEEIVRLCAGDLDAISDLLGEKPFLLGDEPCGADASVFGAVACVLCDAFETDLRRHALKRPNLSAYRDRGMARWFPEFAG